MILDLANGVGVRRLRSSGHLAAVVLAAALLSAPATVAPTSAKSWGSSTMPGKLIFWRTSRIATPVTGRIAALPARVGDHVKKGDVLAQIDTQQLKADLAVAEGTLATARSTLAIAEARLAVEQTVYERSARLKDSPAFSGARLDDAANTVAVVKADVEAANALIAQRQAEVEKRQVDIRLATITAEFDGIVVRHLLTVGGLVSSTNDNPHILVMVDDTAPEVEVEAPVDQVARFARGSEVDVTIGGGSQQKARVRAVLPSETPNATTRLVRIELVNPTGEFDDATPVTVHLPSS
ncbi:MAG: efflux RND transporter periplasmic adaptor subunit [Hyphomicrobium sp.]